MDFMEKFSIDDFLGYLFPGAFAACGFYLLLLVTPLQTVLLTINFDLVSLIVFLIISYSVGLVLAGFSSPFVRLGRRVLKLKNPKATIPFSKSIQNDIVAAYKYLFKISGDIEWSSDQYYISRILVEQFLPNATNRIQRQINLMSFREKMTTAVFVWMLAGVSWGIWYILNTQTIWGIVMTALSVILGFIIIIALVNSMYKNIAREVREVYSAFLVGVNTGLFDERVPKINVQKKTVPKME
jgi:hypothetical protein